MSRAFMKRDYSTENSISFLKTEKELLKETHSCALTMCALMLFQLRRQHLVHFFKCIIQKVVQNGA